MVHPVDQKAFDEAVEENISVFGLEYKEAVDEAIKQFQSQGLDTSTIQIQPSEQQISEVAIETIRKQLEESDSSEDIITNLTTIQMECNRSIENRLAFGKSGFYQILINTEKTTDCESVKKCCLETLIALMTNQPDLLTLDGMEIVKQSLKSKNDEIPKFALKLCRVCCILHETNRQIIIDQSIIELLEEIRIFQGSGSLLLLEVLGLFRNLVLDDDVRVEFGKAHEHARLICTVHLNNITQLLDRFKSEEDLIHDTMWTLATLLVRSEFCKQVEEANGLVLIKEILQKYNENEKINRQSFKLLRALAGNDDCKMSIIRTGFAPILVNCLDFHQRAGPTAAEGLKLIAALVLRAPDNSRAFFEADLPPIIVEIMRRHPENKSVQKSASWAVRNMVSRSRYQNCHFLELGIEDVLKSNLRRFKDFEYDTKAALRDLECKVDFKEEWTGKGGKLNTESSGRI